jgi:hypothetical protein
MRLSELAVILGLNDKHIAIDKRVDALLTYLAHEVKDNFPEFLKLAQSDHVPEDKINLLVRVSAKARGIPYIDDNLKKLTESFYKAIIEVRGGNFDNYPFGSPDDTKCDGQDILDLEILPHSCHSYCILARDLLGFSGIVSEIRNMKQHSNPIGHAVLRYRREDGSWRRCDPKWQKREVEGEIVFFKQFPELYEEFASERRPLLHGAKVKDGKQLEYDYEVKFLQPFSTVPKP